jgi:hypothetical protein
MNNAEYILATVNLAVTYRKMKKRKAIEILTALGTMLNSGLPADVIDTSKEMRTLHEEVRRKYEA